MRTDQPNMLPAKRAASLRQLFGLRVAVVGVALLIVVMVVHSAFLLPVYLSLENQADEREAELARTPAARLSKEEQEILRREERVSEDLARLASLRTDPKMSAVVVSVITVPRSGVILTGFTFTRDDAQSGTMILTGVAASRESLRAFEQRLLEESYLDSVRLPVSTYAKEQNIEFTMTLAGSFVP